MSDTIELASELIGRESVTPEDNGCQRMIAERLHQAGFTTRHLRYDPVDNLWARRGNEAPVFVFAGHTDVVPAGPRQAWSSDPFVARIRNNRLYGRGAADMKGSIAAMTIAVERFVTEHPDHKGSIAFLLTSDEEGPAISGTGKVVEYLQQQNITMDWCIVGEPSSQTAVGDQIRIGRRGSLTGRLTIIGTQGHVAYPERANNPIHRASAAINQLCSMQWDDGNPAYPPTSFQISDIHAGIGVGNVIPGRMELVFNFRHGTESTEHSLHEQVVAILRQHKLDFDLEWTISAQPFLTKPGKLIHAVCSAIDSVTGLEPIQSTGGGTSDGRFIAPGGTEVVELGPVNATIHQTDECVGIDELRLLARIYQTILYNLLVD